MKRDSGSLETEEHSSSLTHTAYIYLTGIVVQIHFSQKFKVQLTQIQMTEFMLQAVDTAAGSKSRQLQKTTRLWVSAKQGHISSLL